jgi:hypothetical protein
MGTHVACEPMDRSQLAVVDCAAAEADIERDIERGIPNKVGYYTFELAPLGAGIGDQANSSNNTSFFCFQDGTADGYPANGAPFPGGGCQKPEVEYVDGGNAFCEAQDDDQTTVSVAGVPTISPVAYPRHRAAFVIRAGDNQFYGAQVVNWNWNATGVFPSFVPDGIAFWARSDVESDKFASVYLVDYRSGAPGDTVPGTTYSPSLALKGLEAGCMPTGMGNSLVPNLNVTVASTDPNIQTNSSSLTMVSTPVQCGNRWTALLQTSEHWELHLLPFESFYQELQPNRIPEGITRSLEYDSTKEGPEPAPFYTLAFGIGRGQNISLWIDEVFFYRKKPAPEAN